MRVLRGSIAVVVLLAALSDVWPSGQSPAYAQDSVRWAQILQLYRDVLGREADEGGARAYFNSGLSIPAIRTSMLLSWECNNEPRGGECLRALQRLDAIRRAYQDVLGRAPGPADIRNFLESGKSESEIRATLLASWECNNEPTGGECLNRLNQRGSDTPPGRPIELNQAVTASLQPGQEGRWTFAAIRSRRIRLEASGFDTVMTLVGPRGVQLAEDDDGLGNGGSLIEAVLPETGTYTVSVRSFDGRGGTYRLELRAQDPFPSEVGEALTLLDQVGHGWVRDALYRWVVDIDFARSDARGHIAGTGWFGLTSAQSFDGGKTWVGSLDFAASLRSRDRRLFAGWLAHEVRHIYLDNTGKPYSCQTFVDHEAEAYLWQGRALSNLFGGDLAELRRAGANNDEVLYATWAGAGDQASIRSYVLQRYSCGR